MNECLFIASFSKQLLSTYSVVGIAIKFVISNPHIYKINTTFFFLQIG